ncbi:co-chaperone YbbN [Vitiosangium sp. GDMCC 1.1324]|uniref:thioredoxin family protein n=1 Tax=Vitiosangium sp. (strain GDMCC 1.1324) TaxID=2138576 RepID=UPI000D3C3ECA|nr:thioredoxin family protein [Vitiosangium sp. GDMCC 1.1324]PTL83781.1 thiol reductase thioredoxin [Vitiosangium sp. GDMCC 1.1324]
MAVVSLDSKSFGAALVRPGILLIDWGAGWCAPCRGFEPTFEQVAMRHPDIIFARVDVDAQPELVGVLGVQVLPTLMVFRDGFLLLNHIGALLEPMLEDLVRQARALDMDDMRREVAQYRATQARVRVGLHAG